MGIGAALADKFELGPALQQGPANMGALADQHQRFRMGQAPGQPVHILDMVVPDRDIVTGQLGETWQGAQGVQIIVQYGDVNL